ncbi:MAG: hypothetical protein H7249_04430 [Chitinophagaceae bacterium]|nr:hypothetical protein [Oligoflexus sp.]
MKTNSNLLLLISLASPLSFGCKPVSVSKTASLSGSAVRANLADNSISFAGDPDAKISTCESLSDVVEPLVKESEAAEWKSPTLAEQSGVYILDGKFEIFEPNPPCEGTELVGVTTEKLDVTKTVQIPAGTVPLGVDNLAELKKVQPETKLTSTSLIPVFTTAPARFVKVDFDLLDSDGSAASHFTQEFELK